MYLARPYYKWSFLHFLASKQFLMLPCSHFLRINFGADALFLFVAAIMVSVGVPSQNRVFGSECARRKLRRRTVTAESTAEKQRTLISSKSLSLALGRTLFLISAWTRRFNYRRRGFGNCLVSFQRFRVLFFNFWILNLKLFC